MQYVLNDLSNKPPTYHVTQDDISAPLQRLQLETITGHQSVWGRGGVIAVLYKLHWVGLSEPSWEQEMDLQLSRTHFLRYWPALRTSTAKPTAFTAGCALVRHRVNFPEQRRTFFGGRLRLRPTRGGASPLPRHGAPRGSPPLTQGRRWVVVA